MTFYKCVAIDSRERKLSYAATGDMTMFYRPGIWTRKKKHGPFVFDSLLNVRIFVESSVPQFGTYAVEIWECLAKGIIPIGRLVRDGVIRGEGYRSAARILDRANKDPENIDEATSWKTYMAPAGTFMAEQVYLDKLVAVI